MKSPVFPLTAVVCTYERYDVLAKALSSLADQDLPPAEFEVLVIDNTPDPDRSRQMAKAYRGQSNLTWVHEARPGLSNARNVGLARARGEIIAYLDDDALAEPGWARAIRAAFADLGPAVAAIGGKVVPLFQGPRPAWLGDRLLAYLSMVDLGAQTRRLAPGEWVVGANIAYRRQALAEVGGFSTSLGRIGSVGLLSAEETEVAAKLRARGQEIGYAPRAVVQHLVDANRSNQAWFARRFAWQAVSAVLSGETGRPEDVARAWADVRHYFARLHPADRHVGSLLTDLGPEGDLDWQLGTIYSLIVALLAGGHVAASPAPAASAAPAAPEPAEPAAPRAPAALAEPAEPAEPAAPAGSRRRPKPRPGG